MRANIWRKKKKRKERWPFPAAKISMPVKFRLEFIIFGNDTVWEMHTYVRMLCVGVRWLDCTKQQQQHLFLSLILTVLSCYSSFEMDYINKWYNYHTFFSSLWSCFRLQFSLLCSHAYTIHILFLYLSELRVGSLKYLACGYSKYLVERRKYALGAANLANFHLPVVCYWCSSLLLTFSHPLTSPF